MGITISKYIDFLIDAELLHSLGKGLFTDKASTGFKEFDKALGGGYARGEIVLLVGDLSASAHIAYTFTLAGLQLGEGCVFVTATSPADQVQHALSNQKGVLRIIDCYTARHTQVQSLRSERDVFVAPVDLSVVGVAISRGLSSLGTRRKRAAVDILSTYVTSTKIQRMYYDILDMIKEFRKHSCTALFLFNPVVVEEDTGSLAIEELFDSVIRLKEGPSGRPILEPDKTAIAIHTGKRRILRDLDVDVDAQTA